VPAWRPAGVAVLDGTNGQACQPKRGDERFALCSTFKFLAAAFVLVRVDRGEETQPPRHPIPKSDLVTYSPTTEKHVESGLTSARSAKPRWFSATTPPGTCCSTVFGGSAGLTHSCGRSGIP